MILIQGLVWIAGIVLAIYLAGYQLFFNGAVDMVMAVMDMFQSGATKELAVTAVVGFIKLSVAYLVGWLIVLATGAISVIIGEFK